jgi:hypothetical protein
LHFVGHPGGEESSRGNECVAAPVQKPRVTRDHSFSRAAAHDKLLRCQNKLAAKSVIVWQVRPAQSKGICFLASEVKQLTRWGMSNFGCHHQCHACSF